VKIVVINQRDLDSSCWLIQAFGKEYCRNCEYNDTGECGGNTGIAKAIREEKMEVKSRPLTTL